MKLDLKVTEQRINVDEVLSGQRFSEDGAQVLFIGKVRNHNQGKDVVGVSYEAHPKLTEKSFLNIAESACKKWGEKLKIAIHHRVGRLEIGDVSVAIVVSSPHRDEAFLASRYIIEEIKVRSPIWKKEHYRNGDSEWLKGHALCGHEGAHATAQTEKIF